MTQDEYIRKVNELMDIIDSDNAGIIFLDGFERARVESELVKLKYEYFMSKE